MKIRNYIFGLLASVAVIAACTKADNGGGKLQKPVTEIAKISYSEGATINVLGEVVAVGNKGFILSDKTGYLYVFGYDYNAEVGKTYLVEGSLTKYGTVIELKNAKLTASSADLNIPEISYRELTSDDVNSIMSTKDMILSQPVEVSGFLQVSGEYVNLTIPGSAKKGSLICSLDYVSGFESKDVIVKGFVTGNNNYFDILPTSIEINENAPASIVSVSPSTLDFASSGEDKTVVVELSKTEGVTLSASSDNNHFTVEVEDTNVKVTAPASTEEERGTLTINLTSGAEILSTKTVSLYQAAPLPEGQQMIVVDYTEKGYENGSTIDRVTEDGITITPDGLKWYDSGSAVRWYAGKTLTISGGEIIKVKFYFSAEDSDNKNTISVTSGTLNGDTWTTGETPVNTVTFTVDGGSGQRRITKIDVSYKPSEGEEGGEGEEGEEGGEGESGEGEEEGGLEPSYSHTFAVADFTNEDGMQTSLTLSEMAWSFSANFNPEEDEDDTFYFGSFSINNKGVQVGKGTVPATEIKLSTEAIEGTIKSVKVNTSGASDITATLSVLVGGIALGDTATLTSASADYTFLGSATGKLELVWTNTSAKAIYVKSIEIIYE